MKILPTTTLLLAASLAAQSTQTQPGTVKVPGPKDRAPISLPSETVTLDASGKVPAAPAGLVETLGGTTTLGKHTIAVLVGKTDAQKQHVDALCLDANANGAFDAGEQHALVVEARAAQGRRPAGQSGAPIDATLTVDGHQVAVRASYMRMGEDPPMVALQFPAYLEAKVRFGEVEHTIVIADENHDGAFGGSGDLWLLDPSADNPASPYALSSLAEQRFANGQRIGVQVAANQSVTVTSTPASEPDAKSEASHRTRVEHLWFERFDKERDQFVAQRKLDTSRARTQKPIEWNYVTFEQAIELGKKANKPVFVDVLAFWCVWCYRMDYYTYVDAEVAKVLSEQFVPCKILQEQDRVGDYDRTMKLLQAKGIPAMGVFGADGSKPLTTIGGWKKPEDFLADLQKGLAAFQGK